jgi:hypothetical protein
MATTDMHATTEELLEVYWKVPRLGQKRNAGLTYSILAAISFKIVSLETYTAYPIVFFMLQKHHGSNFP